jgi:hypothetical protein
MFMSACIKHPQTAPGKRKIDPRPTSQTLEGWVDSKRRVQILKAIAATDFHGPDAQVRADLLAI